MTTAKLNKNLVLFILGDFHLHGYSTKELAEDYGVCQRHIQKIVKGEVWSKAFEEGMRMVSIHKKAMEREKAEDTAPITLYTESTPFEVIDFTDEDCNVTKRGVFIDADFIHNGGLAEFTPTQLKSLLAIFAHSNDTNTAYPSQQRIAKLTGMNVSTVNKNVQAFDGMQIACKHTGEVLAEDALLRVKRPAMSNPYEMTVYKFSKQLIKHTDVEFLGDNLVDMSLAYLSKEEQLLAKIFNI